ncbi:DUF1329 domain-containing protein [Limnobacter humi]|uniref:DUF1329 domain-containing protein n=1 Tax=Limnobacter humi TaxID=1778671 RepID=A0ABT1WGH3_9BURK|nr:DUF1329 domain-containing protein [Limnobacter humi]MCQ8896622.1 DUF1329 domain-containing protein [Limnobacter humi]
MIQTSLRRLALATVVASACTTVFAQSADYSKLGTTLTPMGAEKAGNAAGTIPAWDGGLSKPPAGFDANKGYLDPFANEKPLFTVTAANMEQYKDKLAPGQMELMKRFPTFKMVVYPSHRTAAYRADIYKYAKEEAGSIKLAEGGNGILNLKKSNVPFPIPTEGVQVIWNHIMRDLGGSIHRISADFPVQTNGSYTLGKREETIAFASYMNDPEPNRIFYYMNKTLAPANAAGEVALVHEPLNQVQEPRLAWQYNPGQRRVIRAPELAYDSPGIGADGLRTNDDFNAFNGAPDRYNWKLIGKKEMFIAYNNYKLTSKDLKYSQILGQSHVNQDLVRYEPHRVWVVEGTLKPGARHIYSKRVFYIDEDSWTILHGDQYDSRGGLWRVREVFGVQLYNAPTFAQAGEVIYDLQARRYLVNALTNEEKPVEFGTKYSVADFSTAALRRVGR